MKARRSSGGEWFPTAPILGFVRKWELINHRRVSFCCATLLVGTARVAFWVRSVVRAHLRIDARDKN